MDEVYLLWLLSISMLICSFISGLVPMAFKMSDNRSRLLALLGSGILVGTALAIIIPEGIDSLYGQRSSQNQVIRVAGAQLSDDKTVGDHGNSVNDPSEHLRPDMNLLLQKPDANMTWIVGASLIVGFLLMLLIDQFSIYQSGGGHQHHYHDLNTSAPYEISKVSRQGDYTLTSQDDDLDIGMEEEEDGNNSVTLDESTNEMKPIKSSGSHNITMKGPATNVIQPIRLESAGDIVPIQSSGYNSNPNRYYDHSRHISATNRILNTKVTPTLGLVIHAAADGIALGAAATTSHRDVEMIIFLAIMLHKAPAAFSLVVLLLHNGLKPPTIRRHLLAFSLSAPIAAIVTYYGLSQQGKEALRRNNATGVAMLFSAGTFLFVATVHVLPELIQNKLLTPREMIFLLGGAFLPLLLAQTV